MSTPTAGQQFAQAFERLRQQYTAELSAQLVLAQDCLARWNAGEREASLLVEAHRALHSVAGAAGTFGHPAVGEQAKALELELDDLIKHGDVDARAVATRLSELIACLPTA